MKKLGLSQFAIFCKALKMLLNSKSREAEHWCFKKKAKINYWKSEEKYGFVLHFHYFPFNKN